MRHWSKEERAKQSNLIRSWAPWENSSGPKTNEGKETCKMNAQKHGRRAFEIRRTEKLLAKSKKILRTITQTMRQSYASF